MTHEVQQSDCEIYEAGDKSSLVFIMEFLNSTWYATLEHPDTFFAKVTELKLLEHLEDLCTGLH